MARKVPPQKPTAPPVTVPPAPEKAGTPLLELPKGAMIAYRKAIGGKAMEFFLYPDGRISFNVPDEAKERYAHPSRMLNDGQINQLRHLLEHSNFYHAQSSPGKPKSDSAVHTISARVGSKANEIELVDGSIPDALKPLVDELVALLPKEK